MPSRDVQTVVNDVDLLDGEFVAFGEALVSVQVIAGAFRSCFSFKSFTTTVLVGGKVVPPSRASLRQFHR